MSISRNAVATGETSSPASGSAVFEQVSDELTRMAAATHRLQQSLSTVLQDFSDSNPSTVLDLQQVDEITQTLENLAQFMNALSAPTELELDSKTAAKYLTLKALAERLANPDQAPGDLSDLDDSGELDLF